MFSHSLSTWVTLVDSVMRPLGFFFKLASDKSYTGLDHLNVIIKKQNIMRNDFRASLPFKSISRPKYQAQALRTKDTLQDLDQVYI